MSSLPECEWPVPESQKGMTQDEVKIVCRGATPWKMGIILRGRVELFTGGWVSCCWVPKRDNAGWSEISLPMCKKKDKHLVWCNLMYKKVFLILSHIMWTPFGMIRHETIFLFFLFTLNRFYKRKNICWWELWIFSEVDTQRCSFTGEHPCRNVFQ